MDSELADEMIVLRAMALDDAPALVDGEDDEAVRWLTGGPGTLETATRHITTSLEQWRTSGPRRAWGVYDRETGLLAGTTEVHLALDSLATTEANISYSVFPAFRGRRYAARAVELICQWLAEMTDKSMAVIRVDPRNLPSARIPIACGFTEQGMVITPDGDRLMKYVRDVTAMSRAPIFHVIEHYWRKVFGLDNESLWPEDVAVATHGQSGTLHNYSGVWVVSRGEALRISVPPHLLPKAQEIVRQASPSDIRIGQAFEALFAPSPKILGPSFHAYATLDTLRPVTTGYGEIREVGIEMLDELRNASSSEEWGEGGFGSSPARYFALFQDDQVVAAANLTAWRTEFDDVGLIVHPEHRGDGFGVAIGSYAASIAAQEHGIVRYRARYDNYASVAIQRKLGFEIYCEQTAVRSAD